MKRRSEWSLQPHPFIEPCDGPLLVAVLDGWGEGGVAAEDEWNAIYTASTPCMGRAQEGWGDLKARLTVVDECTVRQRSTGALRMSNMP